MNLTRLIDHLAKFPAAVRAVTADVDPEEAQWRPPDGAWSISEIVGHLGDEEEFDFPFRLQLTLSDPTAPWTSIDPEGVVADRNHRMSDLSSLVDIFAAARRESIAWLYGVSQPNWNNCYQHPQIGPLRAGDLVVAWAAHDQLHLRQIAKRKYQLIQRDAGEFTTRYAGELN